MAEYDPNAEQSGHCYASDFYFSIVVSVASSTTRKNRVQNRFPCNSVVLEVRKSPFASSYQTWALQAGLSDRERQGCFCGRRAAARGCAKVSAGTRQEAFSLAIFFVFFSLQSGSPSC